jgi:hypothetical protein
MTALLRALAALALVAPFMALLSGCSAGLGEFCWTNDDCDAGLRCSASGTNIDGDRGVCTYPDGVPDAAAPDQRQPDLRGSDAADLGLETASDLNAEATTDLTSESGSPDGPIPDAPAPDAPAPDAPAPDAPAPDAPAPDAQPQG